MLTDREGELPAVPGMVKLTMGGGGGVRCPLPHYRYLVGLYVEEGGSGLAVTHSLPCICAGWVGRGLL